MGSTFRLGIVGAGLITAQSHLPAALACQGVEVTALVDPHRDQCKELAQKHKISPYIATSVSEILTKVDGAIISTPNHLHAPVALECLTAGIHVLIEKPLAITPQEGEELVEAADKNGLVIAVGYMTRFRESVKTMGELLKNNFFGKIHQFVYQFGIPGGWSPVSAYNLNRDSTGGGVLVVNGTHFLDRMLNWFGWPDDFTYKDDSFGGPEANAVATFNFSNSGGVVFEGHIRLSKTIKMQTGFVMATDEGTVILTDGENTPILLHPRRDPAIEMVINKRTIMGKDSKNEFQQQLENFIEAVDGKCKPMVSGTEGVLSLQLLEQLYARREPIKEDWYDRPGLEVRS